MSPGEEGAAPETDATPEPAPTPDQAPTEDAEEPFDRARADALIAKLRDEVKTGKSAAKDLAAATARIKELEDATLSDSQRQLNRIKELEAQNASLQASARSAAVERAVRTAANAANAIDPDVIADLLKGSAEAEFDKDGNVTNAKALVELAKSRYPRLFGGGGSADGGAGGRTNGAATDVATDDMNAMIRRAAGRG